MKQTKQMLQYVHNKQNEFTQFRCQFRIHLVFEWFVCYTYYWLLLKDLLVSIVPSILMIAVSEWYHHIIWVIETDWKSTLLLCFCLRHLACCLLLLLVLFLSIYRLRIDKYNYWFHLDIILHWDMVIVHIDRKRLYMLGLKRANESKADDRNRTSRSEQTSIKIHLQQLFNNCNSLTQPHTYQSTF